MEERVCSVHTKDIDALKDEMSDTKQALTVVTFGVENMNKSLETLVESIKKTSEVQEKMNESMIKHWANQEQIIKDTALMNKKVYNLENTQKIGCEPLKAYKVLGDERIKRYDAIVADMKEELKKNREAYDHLNEECVNAKAEIKNLQKHVDEVEAWKKKVTWFLVTKLIGIVGALAGIIWTMN